MSKSIPTAKLQKENVMKYEQFINSKVQRIQDAGFDPDSLNQFLFPFQEHIVRIALKKGRYAIFADCGMGKTLMQLAWADAVCEETGGWVLILCPLAVADQTIEEGQKFGVSVDWYGSDSKIQITNYDQLDNVDCSQFVGVVLDESSILKNFSGKIKTKIIESFSQTQYRLACTATPSPNDPMELGNHAEFLGVMKRNEMLAMYFVHDGGQTSKWRLKGHAQDQFWGFIGQWSTMIAKPNDIGFHMDGFDLPSLNFISHEVKTPKKDNGLLFNTTSVSATNFNKELRSTMDQRLEKTAELVNHIEGPVIVWVKQNEESNRIAKMIPGCKEVKGSDDREYKKNTLLGFAKGEFRVLVTKAKIAQFGLNYQNCSNQVFMSPDFSFESLYQAVRRSYRFGQKKDVNINIIKTDTMKNVVLALERKEKQFETMQLKMRESISFAMRNNESTESDKVFNSHFEIQRGDCVEKIQDIKSESIGFSVFSPPFAELYTYSDNVADMGNSKDYKEFLTHFDFLTEELFRVLKSGRNVAIHCMDLPIQKGKEGFIGLRDFSGMILQSMKSAGFIYHSRVTIWKNPVMEMQRTKALGLLHKQIKKDSTMSRVGIPDYVLVFRKDGERNDPVKNTDLPVDLWQKYASPVWMDIDYGNTLNARSGREKNDEKHICPLQLDTIERLIHLYTNKGDVVFTPFMGVGSEVYKAILMGRKGKGIELKHSYFREAVKNCNSAVMKTMQLSII